MTATELTISELVQASWLGPPDQPIKTVTELRQLCFNSLVREFNPCGFAETLLIREIARCGAKMIRDEQVLDRAEARAEQSLECVLTPSREGDPTDSLVQICGHERMECLARAILQNSSAFVLRLRQLRELQKNRDADSISVIRRDARFSTEISCITYLARRFRLGLQTCRCCGRNTGGSWIAARRCWECSACHAQTCARDGTVMARSHVALTTWFHAIRICLHSPQINASDLASAIEIRRIPTVRSMLAKIRGALAADNATQLLAGLDDVYLAPA